MPLKIIREDITRVHADAIVNTANPRPIIGRGTDMAVYLAAGAEDMLAERKKIGGILPGQAAATGAFRLNARYVIHTVGPQWRGGGFHERETLGECYTRSLALADRLKCESAAFPLISAGIYGFPKDEALSIAFSAISRFLLSHDMTVILAVFDRDAFEMSGRLFTDLEDLIGGRETARPAKETRGIAMNNLRAAPEPRGGISEAPFAALEEALDTKEDSFVQKLFRLIDERGLDDVTVYKRANIDRKLFSGIRCKKNYHPKKKTAVALAIALELSMDETADLLARAGYALSPNDRFDVIIAYFISRRFYSVWEINAALFKYGEQTLD
ncbi:MAG: macro domain-containing protein [Clostridia bacterium]|nr:macro domain-containing protein [Clostridia bacterium]